MITTLELPVEIDTSDRILFLVLVEFFHIVGYDTICPFVRVQVETIRSVHCTYLLTIGLIPLHVRMPDRPFLYRSRSSLPLY